MYNNIADPEISFLTNKSVTQLRILINECEAHIISTKMFPLTNGNFDLVRSLRAKIRVYKEEIENKIGNAY